MKTWKDLLSPETEQPYYKEILKKVSKERERKTIFPPKEEVFAAFKATPLHTVQVVIVGQDPYANHGQANGLAFSVRKGVEIPPSLVNVFREVRNDFDDNFKPKHGDLTGWAKQGVLLLNAILTVRSGDFGSHANLGWERFTNQVIRLLDDHLDSRCVYLLWGQKAQEKGQLINKGHILRAGHPSPRSAERGFFGCHHFTRANDYLLKIGRPGVDWTDL